MAPVISVIDDDVVTTRVEHVLVVDEVDVHLHVSLETTQELGLQRDILGTLIFSTNRSALRWRTSCGSCILLTFHGILIFE